MSHPDKAAPRPLPERLARLQFARAGAIVAIAFALAAAAVPLILQLGLNSAWEALLPENKPSVIDAQRARHRAGGVQTLTVALESDDLEAMQRFATDLVPRIEALPRELVRNVEWSVRPYETFVEDNRHLFAETQDLQALRDALEERLEYERSHANPFFVALDDEEPADPQELIDRMRAREQEARSRSEDFPGGFYVHPDQQLLALFIRTDIRGGQAAKARELMRHVEAEAADLGMASYAEDLTLHLGGSLTVAVEEHSAIKDELILATLLTILGVLCALFVFFRNVPAIFLVGGSLMVPVLMAFGVAELTVDSLNTSTAFLGSIVIGNGINPNIIWLSRYFEERRRGNDTEVAIANTHRSVWLATLAASLAAAVAYGSLIITDFKGFSDFGIIGGTGMILCWLGATLVLPAMAALAERVRPLVKEGADERSGFYGRLFAKIVFGAPKVVVIVSLVLSVVSAGLVYWAIQDDPIEYDFRNLRSVREGSAEVQRIQDRVGEIGGRSKRSGGIVMLVDERSDVEPVVAELDRMRDEDEAPWGRVRSIVDLLPPEQEARVPLVQELRALLLEFRGYADEAQQAEIDANMPPEDVHILTDEDLPEDVVRPFRERDGSLGRIILIAKLRGALAWDGRYLVDVASRLRQVRTPAGERPPVIGRAPIFADIIEVIWTDGPLAIGASFFATLALVFVAFRALRERLLTMLALVLGIAWMAATMALAGMKLNFLNFVAFPITFGNGVDYGVNVMRRYEVEAAAEQETKRDPIRAAIEETGGAVILCSLTTIIGYATLYTSGNLALNSFGAAMAISEVTCLASAVLTVPAIMLLLRNRAARPNAETSGPDDAKAADSE